MLTVNNITYQVGQAKLLKDISFSIKPGEMVAILGANGAGKSTLLKILSGTNQPESGTVSLHGRALNKYTSVELAHQRTVLTQQNVVSLPFLVKEIVMMGRYPHYQNNPSAKDVHIVQIAMEATGVQTFAERSYPTLSGGEQQRVQLARALAQVWEQPHALLLMDEPVAGMDILYQQQTLAILRSMAQKKFIVVSVLHDMNLAAQYADRIIMMKRGRKWYDGTPAEVLNPKSVYEIFEIEADVFTNPSTLKQIIISHEITFEQNKTSLKL
ncbi:heme ABC transporter ATP-binding protein [Mucilaginibacter lappiensis]|uniref:Iron complex transport system ATP-binding protein n=1 Tax=Mucilaginibacter lappiensis TaxID=354630 RepID=A0A841J8U4_9SPHI|nr:heme ABC transporter ATP-binding protein [Mucilaginibacter lappiensis]MBB6125986.1 iron complex transport system ATP-binding protein [Mucilaginibacter lappiensis]